MRQSQHKNRSRSRNRRQPNNANKVYESNGPDVKVRGTAQHIADKYTALGRDALSSGDTVKAEGYFQYAEHYLRIVAAAQEQAQLRRQQQMEQREAARQQPREQRETRSRGNGRDKAAVQGEAAPDQPGQAPKEAPAEAEKAEDAAPVISDAWGGPQPGFLAAPAAPALTDGEEDTAQDKPKRARRSRAPRRSRKTEEAPKAAEAADDKPAGDAAEEA